MKQLSYRLSVEHHVKRGNKYPKDSWYIIYGEDEVTTIIKVIGNN